MKKKKLSKEEAFKIARKMGIDFNKDVHAQSFSLELASLAKLCGYKKPQHASGSTAREFFYHLIRVNRMKKKYKLIK